MLVLGTTADDKGAQLEALVRGVLHRQEYTGVRLNVVRAGGNELDIQATREVDLMGEVQVTPLLGEAKAYAGPLDMPTWHKFLGKLLIERATNSATIGLLVALNGVNGNVAGSYQALRERDKSLFVIEGSDLVDLAIEMSEVSDPERVATAATEAFHRRPLSLEAAFYDGAFYWVLRWKGDEYSIVDGQGRMLLAEDVEALRHACEASLTGTLLGSDEQRAAAEAHHHNRVAILAELFAGNSVPFDGDPGAAAGDVGSKREALEDLVARPFCRIVEGNLVLLPAAEMDAEAITRLFLCLFEDTVRVSMLARFMVDRLHQPYVDRLVDLVPDVQAGFVLAADEQATLRQIAVPFPSVWATLGAQMPMLANSVADSPEVHDAVADSHRSSFWEAVIGAVRSDYANQHLRGFLYDYMDVAELEAREEFVVKGKGGPLGAAVRVQYRTAVRQFVDPDIGDEADGPHYIQIRVLPTQPQPWDDVHPEPAFPLHDT
jgi:hypothetical protein